MVCYFPLTAWRSKSGRDPKTGRWPLVFRQEDGYHDLPVQVPCGQCIGCRLERSRQWAIRCVHEASMYDFSCFITLTYRDEALPLGGSLFPRHMTLFLKRLRKKFGSGIRFFQCGEYGELFSRPHHHAILFGFDFPDRVFFAMSHGYRLYRSEILETLWPYGYCTIGDVTFESVAYVARYVLKKRTGKEADDHYAGRVPEYVTMSRRPGIGRAWIEKYSSDVYPEDRIVVRDSFICRPPRYYDDIFDHADPLTFARVKSSRFAFSRASCDNTPDRLLVREEVQRRKADRLIRPFENGGVDFEVGSF